jgi:PST family polysaccharide transporter
MIKFGIPVMLAGLLNAGTLLLARSLILRELGIEASGHFQASWTISITYLGFILGAMGTDYYPRLTAAMHSPENARRLVNEQGEMALLLGGAVVLAVITVAPLIMTVLYSSAFKIAGEVLRWQMLGSVIKLIGWPMGFVVLASGRSGLFVYTQFVWNAIFLLCLYLLLDEIGLLAVGVGFCLAYAVGALNVWFVVKKLIGIIPTRFNLSLGVSLIALGGLVIYLSGISFALSLLVGSLMTAIVALFSVKKLNALIDMSGWLKNRYQR